MSPRLPTGTKHRHFIPFDREFSLGLSFYPFVEDKGQQHTLFCNYFSAEIRMRLSEPKKETTLFKGKEEMRATRHSSVASDLILWHKR